MVEVADKVVKLMKNTIFHMICMQMYILHYSI